MRPAKELSSLAPAEAVGTGLAEELGRSLADAGEDSALVDRDGTSELLAGGLPESNE